MKKPNIISALLDIFAQTKKNTELLQNLQNQSKNEPVAAQPAVSNRKIIRVSTRGGAKDSYEVTVPADFVGKLGKVSVFSITQYEGDKEYANESWFNYFVVLPKTITSDDIHGWDAFNVYHEPHRKQDKVFVIEYFDDVENVLV